MIKEIRLPELSESTHTADVVKVLVKVGDVVAVDQPLLELETDKAVFEMPSTDAGTVVEVLAQKGGSVKVGQVVVRVEAGGKMEREGEGAGERGEEEPARAVAALAPSGDEAGGKALAPMDADSTEHPMDSPSSFAPPSTSAPVAPSTSAPAAPSTSVPAAPSTSVPAALFTSAPAAPGVRRLARELGVEISQVQGRGPRGRISADDVKIHAKLVMGGHGGGFGAPAFSKGLPDFGRFGPVRREAMSKVRRITTESMVKAWASVPMVTQYDKADITDLEAFRSKHSKKVEAAGGKLTVTAILVKAIAGALKAFPQFNASLDVERGEIVFKDFVNIGVAVDTDRGLLVPVVRDADRENITALSVEIAALAEKARTKRIVPEDLEGGSFTLSNLGGIGGVGFSPIVYWPQVAILGASRSEMQPVWKEGAFVPRLILPLSLSYDHRLIDGADGARFLRWICQALEEPMLLALEG